MGCHCHWSLPRFPSGRLQHPCPLLGGSVQGLIEKGLQALLQEVLAETSSQPARDGIGRVGLPQVQAAMEGPNPWKQLKQVGNQCNPPFHWILPSDLQVQVQARVASGVPLPPKRRTKEAHAGSRQPAPAPVLLQPEHFRLAKGVFVAGSPSQELCQLGLSEVGPHAVGVIVTTKALAEPFLCLSKPVSAGLLAIFLLGKNDASVTAAAACKVQFPATSDGVYFEPRDSASKRADPNFSVI